MNLSQLPLIGSLIAKGQNALASGVQNIKERIADFHLVPRQIVNFRARTDQLSRVPTVTTNSDDMGKIVDLRNKITYLTTNYDSVNRMLDTAMEQVQQVQAGNVSIAAAGIVASTVKGMNDVMASARSIDNLLASIEQRVLTPQQMAYRGSLGVAPVAVASSVFASKGFLLALGLGGIAVAMGRKRGRRS
jgi:hypothetical protein